MTLNLYQLNFLHLQNVHVVTRLVVGDEADAIETEGDAVGTAGVWGQWCEGVWVVAERVD